MEITYNQKHEGDKLIEEEYIIKFDRTERPRTGYYDWEKLELDEFDILWKLALNLGMVLNLEGPKFQEMLKEHKRSK